MSVLRNVVICSQLSQTQFDYAWEAEQDHQKQQRHTTAYLKAIFQAIWDIFHAYDEIYIDFSLNTAPPGDRGLILEFKWSTGALRDKCSAIKYNSGSV